MGKGFEHLSWMPTQEVKTCSWHVTYKAEALGHRLGLSNRWITFHGHWLRPTHLCFHGSFKDMEAVPTIQRLKEHGKNGIICASAGNTLDKNAFLWSFRHTRIVVDGKDHGHVPDMDAIMRVVEKRYDSSLWKMATTMMQKP